MDHENKSNDAVIRIRDVAKVYDMGTPSKSAHSTVYPWTSATANSLPSWAHPDQANRPS